MTSFDNSGIVPPAPLAQSEEQRTFNPRVRGSKPRRGTTHLLAALPERMRAKRRPNGRTIRNRRTCQVEAQRRSYHRSRESLLSAGGAA